MSSPCALICGAGLAGLALARTLRSQGWQVDLIERAQKFDARQGVGLILTANGVSALKRLRISEGAMPDFARSFEAVRLFDADGDPLGTVVCDADTSAPGNFSMRHRDLRNWLAEGQEITLGCSIAALQIATEHAEVTFADGREQSYHLVVGADGIHSVVRELGFGRTDGKLDQYSGYRFLIDAGDSLDNPEYYFGNGATLLLVPLSGSLVYCGAGPIAIEALREGSDWRETVVSSFGHFCEPVQKLLSKIDHKTHSVPSTFGSISIESWVKGPVVLIGDAAHAMPPTLSQGAAMAFEDVEVLQRCLTQCASVSAALRQYQLQRTPRIAWIQKESIRRMSAISAKPNRVEQARKLAYRLSAANSMQSIWTQLSSNPP